MILNKKLITSVTVLAIALGLSGCAGGYEPVPNMAKLDAKFADASWDGKIIPNKQWCSLYSGNGFTPEMIISNVPKGTNAIIMEINDEGYSKLSTNGGHGKIGFWINQDSSTITLMPVQGETSKDLPYGAFIESASRSTGRWATSGYLPPCSGGKGHMYSAEIKAVYKAKNKDEKSKLLGETYIQLGRY